MRYPREDQAPMRQDRCIGMYLLMKKLFTALAILIVAQQAWGWESHAWQDRYDFDGDRTYDPIEVSFSGGAHCCYKIGVTLSSNHRTYKLPFEMDGGYVGGLDLSRPDQFGIQDLDRDGNYELFMTVNTYSYWTYPIPSRWKKQYGFNSNYILVDFKKGVLRVRDLKRLIGKPRAKAPYATLAIFDDHADPRLTQLLDRLRKDGVEHLVVPPNPSRFDRRILLGVDQQSLKLAKTIDFEIKQRLSLPKSVNP